MLQKASAMSLRRLNNQLKTVLAAAPRVLSPAMSSRSVFARSAQDERKEAQPKAEATAAPQAPSSTDVSITRQNEPRAMSRRRGGGELASVGRMNDFLTQMQREMDTLMNAFMPSSIFGPTPTDPFFSRPFDTLLSSPITTDLDIEETDNEYIMTALVPGFNKDQIKITLSPDHVLTLQGEIKEEPQAGDEKAGARRRAARYASFVRRVRLPPGVDPEGIKATTKEGVLEVHVPKGAEHKAQVKEIPIS